MVKSSGFSNRVEWGRGEREGGNRTMTRNKRRKEKKESEGNKEGKGIEETYTFNMMKNESSGNVK